ncbi:PAAR domain-containing protein [Sphingomonas bacterium]|uniref:PAAR domain-containing protein n=1 Tax=Sphingomonas bacterium TaxID=1895847 RepID=UPI0015753BC5|nr:PAAR domain-containing protein [Sphingomonas bacterium]
MGQPAARLGDMHVCPMVTPGVPPVPHVGGPILPPCSVTVLTGMIPQARITDMCVCVGPPDTIAKGSATVLVNSLMAARMGDLCLHGGSIVIGLPTVLIGDSAGGGGGGAPEMAQVAQHNSKNTQEGAFSTAAAYTAPAQQAAVYKNAARTGAPFCERCGG